MTQVSLVWATPDAEALVAQMARVSNPANQEQALESFRDG
jgi:hypothetical protein